jgi:hypothetical protein
LITMTRTARVMTADLDKNFGLIIKFE